MEKKERKKRQVKTSRDIAVRVLMEFCVVRIMYYSTLAQKKNCYRVKKIVETPG